MEREELEKILEEHKEWIDGKGGKRADLCGVDLSGADLREAGLYRADLRGANLSEANLDFSTLPLWCGSLKMTVDKRIAAQIAYHFCRLACDDAEFLEARNSILKFANQFHRVNECGVLEEIKLNSGEGGAVK